MTDEAKSILSDEDKALLMDFKRAQETLIKSIQRTDQALMVLQRTVAATLGSDQYWAKEAIGHLKLGMLTLMNAIQTQPNIQILNELRKRKAQADLDMQAIEKFKSESTEVDLMAASNEESPPVPAADG